MPCGCLFEGKGDLMLFSQLLEKDIFCITDGRHLGYLDDLEVDIEADRLLAIICKGRPGLFSLMEQEGLRIPVEQIYLIGADSILVNCPNNARESGGRRSHFLERFFHNSCFGDF